VTIWLLSVAKADGVGGAVDGVVIGLLVFESLSSTGDGLVIGFPAGDDSISVAFKVVALAALALVTSVFTLIGAFSGLFGGVPTAVVDFEGSWDLPVPVGDELDLWAVGGSNLPISEATLVGGGFAAAVVVVVVVVGVEGLGTVVPEGPAIGAGVLVDTDADLVSGGLGVAADAKALTAAALVDAVSFFTGRLGSALPLEAGGPPGGFDAPTSTKIPAPTSDIKAMIREMFILYVNITLTREEGNTV
jgi:hypothetical protein